MDDTIRFNQERWEELASAKVIFSRPWLDLDETVARERVDPEEVFGKIRGKDVLCLAGGGGQQSAAFGLLGARVTVFDFSQPSCSGIARRQSITESRSTLFRGHAEFVDFA